jgi:hypothetical protein
MLANRHIEVGRYYVNEEGQKAREVLEISSQIVVYSSFDLDSGGLCGMPFKLCTRKDIIHWADREATREEVSGLHRDEVQALFTNHQPDAEKNPEDLEYGSTGLHETSRRNSFKQ